MPLFIDRWKEVALMRQLLRDDLSACMYVDRFVFDDPCLAVYRDVVWV